MASTGAEVQTQTSALQQPANATCRAFRTGLRVRPAEALVIVRREALSPRDGWACLRSQVVRDGEPTLLRVRRPCPGGVGDGYLLCGNAWIKGARWTIGR